MTVRSRAAVSHSLNLLISICRRHQAQLNCVIAGKELFTFLIMRSINLAQFVREQICSSRTSLKSSLIPIIASAPSSYAALVPHRRASLIITDRTMRAGAGRRPEQTRPHRSARAYAKTTYTSSLRQSPCSTAPPTGATVNYHRMD